MKVFWSISLAVAMAALPATARAAPGGDPFSGLGDSIAQGVPIWGGIMAMVAALVVAGVAYYGSQHTGRWIGKFIVGTIFIVLATMGLGLLPWLKGFFNIGK